MEIITSLNNNKIKELSKLLNKKYRDQTNLFLVEGEHLVKEAYNSNLLQEIICTPKYENYLDIKTTYVSKEIINKLSDTITPQEIIGVVKKKEENTIGNKVLILDNIQDPGNLGTIIRSSVAFNIDTIILSNDTVDLYNPKVIRSSEGMFCHINVITMDLEEAINIIKTKNIIVYGTDVVDGEDVSEVNDKTSYALIMGNEGNGVKSNIQELCDENLYIPMQETCESLNVGVACSILLYELGE
jgi:TrmH family RNA methyltransferase